MIKKNLMLAAVAAACAMASPVWPAGARRPC
jgi:hypothetical protein